MKTAVLYHGLPGVGGISLIAQPDLVNSWIAYQHVELSSLTLFLLDHCGTFTAVALALTFVAVFRLRPEPMVGGALIFLAVWAFGINFFLQYLVWGTPFLLMAGYVREVALGQLVVLPTVVLTYGLPWSPGLAPALFAGLSIAIWLCALIGFVLLLRRLRARPPGPDRRGPPVAAAAPAS